MHLALLQLPAHPQGSRGGGRPQLPSLARRPPPGIRMGCPGLLPPSALQNRKLTVGAASFAAGARLALNIDTADLQAAEGTQLQRAPGGEQGRFPEGLCGRLKTLCSRDFN